MARHDKAGDRHHKERQTGKIGRWIARLTSLRFEVVNVSGKNNCVVDGLSRLFEEDEIGYDVELYQRIEHLIGKKLPLYVTQEAEVMILQERVAEAQRIAKTEMKDGSEKKQGHGKRKGGVLDDDDMEEAPGVRKRLKGKKKIHRH
uniref:Uncharacterized protein n=1 Tax=Timema shepardi TaxID=629360 RepID=A0A7R9ATN8_TIMSH|nr:unnamed protein product [Timema shepardi]